MFFFLQYFTEERNSRYTTENSKKEYYETFISDTDAAAHSFGMF